MSLKIISSIIVEIAEVAPCRNQGSEEGWDDRLHMKPWPARLFFQHVYISTRHQQVTDVMWWKTRFRDLQKTTVWAVMRPNALPTFQGEWQVLFIRGTSRFIDALSRFKWLRRWMEILNITCMNEDCVSGRSSSHSTDRQQKKKKRKPALPRQCVIVCVPRLYKSYRGCQNDWPLCKWVGQLHKSVWVSDCVFEYSGLFWPAGADKPFPCLAPAGSVAPVLLQRLYGSAFIV